MRVIAVINFKGGVGKTTMTWCMGEILARAMNKRVLAVDFDAQMSLTTAIAMNRRAGKDGETFQSWYDRRTDEQRTMFNAFKAYCGAGGHIAPIVDKDFVYPVHERLYVAPAHMDMYWIELLERRREGALGFAPALLKRLGDVKGLPKFQYALFDCPPSFTLAARSALTAASQVLVPVNPDIFAVRGVNLFLDALTRHFGGAAGPPVALFMNRVRTYGNAPVRETAYYMDTIRDICAERNGTKGLAVRYIEAYVRERADVRNAVREGRLPTDLYEDVRNVLAESMEMNRG